MTNIIICGVYDLKAAIARSNPDLVISITDPEAASREAARQELRDIDCPVLELEFHDIDRVTRGFTSPGRAHAALVKSAIEEHDFSPDATIIVHCAAGISRSPAIALLALGHLAQKSQTPTDAIAKDLVEQVFVAAPDASPNGRIMRLVKRELSEFGAQIFRAAQARAQEAETRLGAQPFSW